MTCWLYILIFRSYWLTLPQLHSKGELRYSSVQGNVGHMTHIVVTRTLLGNCLSGLLNLKSAKEANDKPVGGGRGTESAQ